MFNLKKALLYLVFSYILLPAAFAQTSGRFIKDISDNNWSIWLDKKATWINDTLYVPPVDIKKLLVNLPSGGWNELENAGIKKAHLPATAEEYLRVH